MLSFRQAFNFPTWPFTNQSHEPVLILGADTSLGLAAVQLGSLCGRRVIAVCESNEQSLVQTFGAEMVLDYLNPDLITKVLQATQDALSFAMDCSFKEESLGIAAKCLGSKAGGVIAQFPLLLMGERHNATRDVSIVQRLPPTLFGFEAKIYGQSFHPQSDEIKHTHAFFRTLTSWIAEGKMKPLPSQMASKQGINGLVLALEEIKNGGDEKMGGKRLISALGVSFGA
ncbi:hypothetical protein BDY24DRAFT_379806 [Mrakia frigida]|uniref:uncharacterized protein n=1 Tax=Mrakia frigida TaxID=29902 RepID=UPI003FCC21E7